ncbi:MAG: hypothetical protein WC498_01380 [Candidatus Saccharimonadales bacterium]
MTEQYRWQKAVAASLLATTALAGCSKSEKPKPVTPPPAVSCEIGYTVLSGTPPPSVAERIKVTPYVKTDGASHRLSETVTVLNGHDNHLLETLEFPNVRSFNVNLPVLPAIVEITLTDHNTKKLPQYECSSLTVSADY